MRIVVAAVTVSLALMVFILRGAIEPPPVMTQEERAAVMQALLLPPAQTPTTRPSFAFDRFRLTPRAEYDITARVYSTHRYYWNFIDHFHRVSPEDLALGWGKLSDYSYKKTLHVWQEDRFFKYRWRGAPPLPLDEIVCSLANTHMIPASDKVANRLEDVRPNDIVHMKGALVDVRESGYGAWSTSLTRTDSGPGACEIMWVESIDIVRE